MNCYEKDRDWSDQFIPTIKSIVGSHLLAESSFDVDANQAADLVVLRARGLDIACRVRRPGYFKRYPYDFTIRSERDSGASTELEKLINGFGDWMFYGHASMPPYIGHWMLIDLAAWRSHMIRRNKVPVKCGQRNNRDGTKFVWFDASSFSGQPPLLIATNIRLESAWGGVPFPITITNPAPAQSSELDTHLL